MQTQTALDWGDRFRRHVMAAAALQGVYTVRELAHQTHISEGTINDWWDGAKPGAPTIRKLAGTTGLDVDGLYRWIHLDGPPPVLPACLDPTEAAEAEERADAAERSLRARPGDEASAARRAPRDSAGSAD